VELDVTRTVDTTLVVVNPGWGDDVQAAKAGLMEIADVLVINKADRAGLKETRLDLKRMLDTGPHSDSDWRPPIVDTVGSEGQGIDDLLDAVASHRDWLENEGRLGPRRAERLWEELETIVAARLRRQAESLLEGDGASELHEEVAARRVDPWSASDSILGSLGDPD
jgi:LAO/AO transport system kinase